MTHAETRPPTASLRIILLAAAIAAPSFAAGVVCNDVPAVRKTMQRAKALIRKPPPAPVSKPAERPADPPCVCPEISALSVPTDTPPAMPMNVLPPAAQQGPWDWPSLYPVASAHWADVPLWPADDAWASVPWVLPGAPPPVSPPGAAVPEPAMWALWIIGFGLVGGAAVWRRGSAA
jgi:hypothetical protein